MFDLDGYFLRKLDIAQGYKPLDFGGGGITGSVNKDGRIIAVNNYHPEHGYVTLTSIPAFPDEDRYDAAKVRAYRRSLVDNDGFGLEFEQEIVEREYYLIEDAVPFMRFTLADGTVAECLTIGHRGGVRQLWEFSNEGTRIRFSGSIWIQRAAYTQLTEGGVVQMPPSKTTFSGTGRFYRAFANNIENAAIQTTGTLINMRVTDGDDNNVVLENVYFDVPSSYTIDAGLTRYTSIDMGDDWLSGHLENIRSFNLRQDNRVISRAGVYAGYTAVAMSAADADCFITDHMILPLSWNRDSYYVASMLLTTFPDRFQVAYNNYLRWLFAHAWRGTYLKRGSKPVAKAWARAYMANGKPKDNNAYQLDQQVFPLLAASDWLERYRGSDTEIDVLFEGIASGLQAILQSISVYDKFSLDLYMTDETPADDELDYPYHFSSHVLLWHTLRRLRKYAASDERIRELLDKPVLQPDSLKKNINTYFVVERNGRQIYSYASNIYAHYFYHDANDIPLVMMPIWGFCDKDDPVWRNTIEFAFSDENPGFYNGVLGSVHTPAPWALGDAQELILCKVIGDRDRYARVWERVEKAAQWDGALPEAYDANTFEVVSRHWFAWPNAMIAIADSISWDWEQETQA